MNALCLILTAALVPWPKEVKFTGGEVKVAKPAYAVDAKLPREGYRISVTKGGVEVWSATDAGRFYAEKTLEQLAENGRYACCEIVDEPAFGYRGFHIDEARHFFGKDAIKKVIDEMSRLKFNHFHWHLTDDQGWRIQLKKYPELTEYGSWRVSSPVFGKMWQRKYDDTKYGPFFYTEEEAREIVAYAAARQITVVPEVDLPGHCQGLLAGYPWMLCEGEKLKPRCARNNWWLAGIRTLCIGNDEALAQVEGIIDEFLKIFPGEYFHFGGDECPDRYWAKCPKCKARMEKEGLRKPHELQGWFTRRFAKYILSKGRKPIGWHEILSAGGLPKGTVIMSWRGTGAGIAAAKQGLQAIMAPGDWCNLNRWDGNSAINEFTASGDLPGGVGLTMDHVRSFDPVADVPDAVKGNVLGGQCCCWSETVFTPRQLEWRFFPRAGAIAEGLWSAGGKPDYRDFRRRIDRVREGMSARGVCVSDVIDVARLSVAGDWKVKVEWGTDERTFDVPPGAASRGVRPVVDEWHAEHYGPQRLDWIVRAADGALEYRTGREAEYAPALPALAAGELLAGTVWVTAGTTALSDANLFACTARRPWIRRGLWNSPLARDFAPKTLKKLRNGGKVKILAWGDSCTAQEFVGPEDRWHLKFAERLRRQYPKAEIELVEVSWPGYTTGAFLAAPPGSEHNFAEKVLAAEPDIVVSEFVNDANIYADIRKGVKSDLSCIEADYRRIASAFKEKGIEWIICLPHYTRPDWMGVDSIAKCDDDPRAYSKMIRKFAAQNKVGLADPTKWWGQLRAMGIPYPVLLLNDINHPNALGLGYYTEALMYLFEEFE